jgi:hypothetical protein
MQGDRKIKKIREKIDSTAKPAGQRINCYFKLFSYLLHIKQSLIFLKMSKTDSAITIACIFLTALIINVSCEKTIFFSGDQDHTLYLETEEFDTVVINDVFNIEVRSDSVYSIRLEGGEKLIKNISVKTNNNSLYLKDNNSFKWLPDYPGVRVTISFPALSKMVLRSPSTITSYDTLHLDNFSLYSLGHTAIMDITLIAHSIRFTTDGNNFGHYTFRGYSRHADLWQRGSSKLFAEDMETEFMKITNNSIADSYVYVNRQLVAVINHYGNVYYRGNPEEIIIKDMSSRGNLYRLEE